MSIYRCSKCGNVDNTALSGYWARFMDKLPALCSECNPEVGKWHGEFEKQKPEEFGYVEGPDGFLYTPGDAYLERQIKERDRKSK